eukprot:3023432-Alexandrium_andersonii.AAC.1
MCIRDRERPGTIGESNAPPVAEAASESIDGRSQHPLRGLPQPNASRLLGSVLGWPCPHWQQQP